MSVINNEAPIKPKIRTVWNKVYFSSTDSEATSTISNCIGGKRFALDIFPASVVSLLQSRKEKAAIRLARQYGHNDANLLTNLVFFARHPERLGCKLVKGEPGFSTLGQEWVDIRNRIVQPHLSKGNGAAVASGIPPLVKIKEPNPPPGLTLYVRIPLGGEGTAEPVTGIFLPEKHELKTKIDIILYLHGHKEPCKGKPNWVIDSYWRSAFFPLREGINETQRNIILVVPTLGTKSESGDLAKPGGLDRYLEKVAAALIEYGPYKTAAFRPEIGNIILACHSGGGKPMLEIATYANRYSANIRECWGFDCLYSGCIDKETKKRIKCANTAIKLYTQPKKWIKWVELQKDKGKRLFIYYQSSTSQESEYLKNWAKAKKLLDKVVFVEQSKAPNHCRVPITHWRKRILQIVPNVER